MSNYGNEAEILFFGGQRSLKFHNIRIIKKKEDYFWFIKALRLFDCIVTGKKLHDFEIECDENEDGQQYILPWDYQIMHQMVNNYQAKDEQKEELAIPTYNNNLFGAFVENKKEIRIDLDVIDIDFDGIKNFLFSDKHRKLIRNCEDILIIGVKNINNGFIDD